MSSSPRAVEERITREGEKSSNMKEETWQELDEKVLTAIQFCLSDEVLDEFSMKNSILVVGVTSRSLSEEVVGESVDSKAASLSSLHA